MGINNIMENYHGYDYAIFGEPGGSMNITAGYKGTEANYRGKGHNTCCR